MSHENTIYIATRRSPLALWQAKKTQSLLTDHDVTSELLTVITTGDKIQNTQLANVNLETNTPHHLTTGKGLFIKEVQEALICKKAQVAVHSMKDLPVEQTPHLVIGALLPRANPSDVLVFSPQLLKEMNLQNTDLNQIKFEDLKLLLLKSKLFFSEPIGTTSTRRQLLMKKLFSPHLNLQVLRGNVDSRIKRVSNNEFSAILLAQAGLERLELFQTQSMYTLPVNLFIPATAQGAIAIECAIDNKNILEILLKINCPTTCLQVAIERLVLDLLEGDCHSSIGIHYTNQNISIIHGNEEIEKNLIIQVTLEEREELNSIFVRTNGIYSNFFTEIHKSSIAQRIENILQREGILG